MLLQKGIELILIRPGSPGAWYREEDAFPMQEVFYGYAKMSCYKLQPIDLRLQKYMAATMISPVRSARQYKI
jgi:hypothetical protein